MKNNKKLVLMGLLLALTVVLGILEHMLPPIPFLPPNVRLGLANVAVMYCLFFIGKKEAFLLAVLKSSFILLTRGTVAAVLSVSGGLFSLSIIILALSFQKHTLSYITYSILGAEFHNIGQITAYSIVMKNWFMLYYLPVLLTAGVIMGLTTGTLLKILMPYFKKI